MGFYEKVASKQHTQSFFFLSKVKFLGHIVSEQGIQLIAKRVEDFQNLKSPENQRDVMRTFGCLDFFSVYIQNLQVDSKPINDLIRVNTIFKWTADHENFFNDIKSRINKDTILANPNVNYPFHIHVDSSSIGTGSNLVQDFLAGKRIVSFNSRVFDISEQEMSTLQRELCGIVSVLKTHEH